MIVTQEQADQALQEIADIIRSKSLPLREPGWWSSNEIAEHMHITRGSATHHLEKAVVRGEMETRLVKDPVNGQKTRVYRPKQIETKDVSGGSNGR